MKIIFLNRVYPPADGATGRLLAELAQQLVQRGCEVTVVTSRADSETPVSETVESVRVERVRTWRFTRASHWRRGLSYLSAYPALLWRAWRLPRADVVVTMTDPPLQLLLGTFLKCVKGSRHVHWAQDIYPELAEELNVLPRNGIFARCLRWMSTMGLRHTDRVIAVGRCMKTRLLARGLSGESIHVVPNWAHQAKQTDLLPNPFRDEHGLGGRFVVMYSGNLGLAHPFEAILEAAALLKATHPEILFLMIGAGPRLGYVKQQTAERALDNVRFLLPQASEKLLQSLGAADLHLASMELALLGLVVPSKIYGILAAGRPCVFLGPGESEAARTLDEFQCGSIMNPADGEGLARCIAQWSENGERRRVAGQRALEASASFSTGTAVHAFHEILLEATRLDSDLALQQTASRTQA